MISENSLNIENSQAPLRNFLTHYAVPNIHLMCSAPGLPGVAFAENVEGALAWVAEKQAQGRDIYWTPNITGANKKPSKAEIQGARFAFVDCDPPKTGTWDKAAEIEKAKRLGASLIVDSGRGFWAYWALSSVAAVTDLEAVEAVNLGIAEHFAATADHCHNHDRAARLPSTINSKTGNLASVIYEVPKRYALSDLHARFGVTKPVTQCSDEAQDLPPHFKYSNMSDPEIIAELAGPLWRGELADGDDRSERDFALACQIAERARTFERACDLFRQSGLDPAKRPAGASKKAKNYVERTMKKAFAKQHEKAAEFAKQWDATPFAPQLPAGASVVPFPVAPKQVQMPGVTVAPTLPGLVAASSFAGKPVPERQWIVESLIPKGYVTDLTADGGTGKSLLALQLAVARSTATRWIGLNAEPGATIYLAAEDDLDELHRRVADICRETGTDLEALDDFHILPLFGEDARLAGLAGKDFKATALYDHLHSLISRVRAGLIIIDTRADTFGGDEVNRAQVMLFVSLLKKLANDHGATVLLISHPSRSGQALGDGQSGSTAWGNAVRSRMYLTRDDDQTLTLATKKANYGPNDTQIKLEWRCGCFVSLGNMSDPFTRLQIDAPIDQEFIELLTQAIRDGRKVGPNTGHNFAPKILADASGTPGKKRQFTEAMARLLKSGRIKIDKSDGPPSKRTDIIVPVF